MYVFIYLGWSLGARAADFGRRSTFLAQPFDVISLGAKVLDQPRIAPDMRCADGDERSRSGVEEILDPRQPGAIAIFDQELLRVRMTGEVTIDQSRKAVGVAFRPAVEQFGFMLARLGSVPKGGEVARVGDYRLTVVDVERNRISKVKIEKLPVPSLK